MGFGTTVQIPGFQSEGIEVIAVCSRTEERASQAAKAFQIPYYFTDHRKMLELKSIDAVSIVTPPELHLPMVVDSLRAGKHVLCEKPFALNEIEAKQMSDLALKTQLTNMITHEFRWAPQRAFVKELLDEGYLGEFKFGELSLFTGPRDGIKPRAFAWGLEASKGGGFLFGLGSHYIDSLFHWFGAVNEVDGKVWTNYPDRIVEFEEFGQATSDDTFRFSLEFEKGGQAIMFGSNVAPFGQGARITLFGTNGTLALYQPGFNPTPEGVVLGARIGDEKLSEIPMPERFTSLVDSRDGRLAAFRLLVREFVRGIKNGESPSPNFLDGLCVQRILGSIIRSADTGMRIKL